MPHPRRRNAPSRTHRSRNERPPQSPPAFWSTAGSYVPGRGARPLFPEEEELLRRFSAEPETPPFTMKLNGETITFPKYNGVNWWIPECADEALGRSRLEGFILRFFTVVNAFQTLSLFVWPISLIYDFGWARTLPSVLLNRRGYWLHLRR